MAKYHQARGSKHGRRGLSHISVHGRAGGGAIVAHHRPDGSAPTEHDFGHDEQGEFLEHVASQTDHLFAPGDESESGEQPEYQEQRQ